MTRWLLITVAAFAFGSFVTPPAASAAPAGSVCAAKKHRAKKRKARKHKAPKKAAAGKDTQGTRGLTL
jgi:hypothetical protein